MTRLEEMKALATEEAIKLKEHATINERMRLDLNTLNPDYSDDCIYGQMTGYCSSERAMELIMLCAKRVYNVTHVRSSDAAVLNGQPFKVHGEARHWVYQSPIEILIYSDNGGEEAQRKLIAFLKDETQTISL